MNAWVIFLETCRKEDRIPLFSLALGVLAIWSSYVYAANGSRFYLGIYVMCTAPIFVQPIVREKDKHLGGIICYFFYATLISFDAWFKFHQILFLKDVIWGILFFAYSSLFGGLWFGHAKEMIRLDEKKE